MKQGDNIFLTLFAVLLISCGCAGVVCQRRTEQPGLRTRDAARALVAGETERWDKLSAALDVRQLDLCSRALAALYWSKRDQQGRFPGPSIVEKLALIKTDRAYEEIMRIALYTNNIEAVRRAILPVLGFYQRLELFPFYSKLLERTDLPDDLAVLCRRNQMYCMYPVTAEQVWALFAADDALLRKEKGARLELMRQVWDEQIRQELPQTRSLFKKLFQREVALRRRARGFAGELYPPPYPGRDPEVKGLLESLGRPETPGR